MNVLHHFQRQTNCHCRIIAGRVIGLYVLILSSIVVTAQSSDYNFINFSSKDGMSSNAVNAILKDHYGYMWFGTDDGLNKFDGETFTVYRHNAGDSISIGGNKIYAICEDRDNNLWIGTNEDLSFYDRRKDAFTHYRFMDGALVRALCFDHDGNLWIGSYAGLYKMDTRTGKLDHYQYNLSKTDQLLSNTIVSVFEDSRRRLWIGTNEGLHQYIKEKNAFKRFRHSDADASSITDNIIRVITEDAAGNVWFGTNDGGLSKLLEDGEHFRNYSYRPDNRHTLSCNRVFSITAERSGKLWVGTEDGINIFDPQTEKVHRVVADPRKGYSLVGKSVRQIYIDRDGVHWVGTFQGGVSKYDRNLVFFNLRQSNVFDPHGLNAPVVTSFVEDANGDIYVGTDGGGLNLFHRQTGLFSHPQLVPGSGNNKLVILSMERVGDDLYIGTYGRGLQVLNMRTGAVKQYKKGNGPLDLLGNDIFCIKKDSKGNIWLGTNGNGVNVFNPHTQTMRRFEKKPSPGVGDLPSNCFIRAIEEDSAGNIWIGSNGTGIAIYNPAHNTFSVLNRANSNLLSNLISALYIDQKGTVWVGTLGGGLSRMAENNLFVSYEEDDGLSNAVIYKILESEPGKLWISTNKGISSFDVKSEKFKNYSYRNGLQKSTFSLGAGLKTSTGELFFGGLEGFNFFHPGDCTPHKVVPSLVFTDLKISNRSVMPGPGEAIKEHISVTKEITLDYKQNFSLDFVALNYAAPHENRYAYMLEGFDKDWNHLGTSRKAVYTNLDPGNYTFRLKASSEDGLWNSDETSIHITVKPPFWRTTYAYAAYIFLAIGFLVGWRYWGIRRLKNKFALEQVKRQIEQERKEAERQHEFDELKIKFLTNLSHEFRTPISLIVGPVEKLLQQEANSNKVRQLTLVKRNSRRLLNLVNQLLDFRKMETNELVLHPVDDNLVAFIKEIVESFRDISESKGIPFQFSSALDHLYMSFDKDKMERVLFNLLSNAFKFTGKNGSVTLAIEPGENSTVKIIVSDTGVGIDPIQREKIFDRFFQGKANPAVLNQGSGIGLSITKEFVQLHGGDISIESIPGKGSVFTVVLPYTPVIPHIAPPELPIETSANNGTIEIAKPNNVIPATEKSTVLIIEDNEDFRSYLKENLDPYYKIIEAADGIEGWQKALSAHPQVVVSDISMPHMDGIELSKKIKSDKRTSHIPVVLLTALTGETNHLEGLQTGAVDYLTKPFNFEILNVKLRNLLGMNQHLKTAYTRHIKIDTPKTELQSDDEKLMLRITKYLEENIDNPDLTVEELSRQVYMSRGSLYSKIMALTGETPVEFIRSFRLNKAIELLQHSDMKIAQVGYAVGFATPNYFTRAFKAKFNVSPSEYFRTNREHPDSGE